MLKIDRPKLPTREAAGSGAQKMWTGVRGIATTLHNQRIGAESFFAPAGIVRSARKPLAPRGFFNARSYIPNVRVRVKHAEGSFSGVLEGRNFEGKAVVITRKGKRQVVPFETVAPKLDRKMATAWRAGAGATNLTLEGIHPSNIHDFTSIGPRFQELVDTALDRPIAHGFTTRRFVEELKARGFEVFLVGGAPRDLANATKALETNPNASLDKLVSFEDMNLVTNALPSDVRQMWIDMSGGRDVDQAFERAGVVGVGPRGSGIDLSSLQVGIRKESYSTLGLTLKDDAASRDFTANQIYIDPIKKLVIDPTGMGIKDARARVLRVDPKTLHADPRITFRYLRFRGRVGWTGEERTKKLVGKVARKYWPSIATEEKPQPKGAPPFKFVWLISQMQKTLIGDLNDVSYAKVSAMLDVYRALAKKDGFGDAFKAAEKTLRETLKSINDAPSQRALLHESTLAAALAERLTYQPASTRAA